MLRVCASKSCSTPSLLLHAQASIIRSCTYACDARKLKLILYFYVTVTAHYNCIATTLTKHPGTLRVLCISRYELEKMLGTSKRERKRASACERENGNGYVCKRIGDLRLDIKQPYNVKVVAAYAAVLDDVGMDLPIVERMYIRAVQLEPTYVLALHGLGTVMHRMERLAEAEMYYKMALKIEPTHEGAFENLEILREATYAQQGVTFVTERNMLRSRDRSNLPSRAGRMSPRSGLQSRGLVRVLSLPESYRFFSR